MGIYGWITIAVIAVMNVIALVMLILKRREIKLCINAFLKLHLDTTFNEACENFKNVIRILNDDELSEDSVMESFDIMADCRLIDDLREFYDNLKVGSSDLKAVELFSKTYKEKYYSKAGECASEFVYAYIVLVDAIQKQCVLMDDRNRTKFIQADDGIYLFKDKVFESKYESLFKAYIRYLVFDKRFTQLYRESNKNTKTNKI